MPSSRLFLGLIPWYGVLIVLGMVLAIRLAEREARRLALPKDTILDLALRILPLGLLGARLYYVLFNWAHFAPRPLSILFIWEGGLAIYGGLIAGVLTLILFCRRRRLSLPLLLDILVPGVALAQALGRWGNYFNQEAYGFPLSSDSPFAFFPLAIQIQEGAGLTWHWAAFFLESLVDFLLFLLLLWGRRRWFRKQGDAAVFYFLLYSAGRLVIENLRIDSLMLVSGVRVSQLLSVLICLAGLLWLLQGALGRPGSRLRLLAFPPALLAALLSLAFCLGLPLSILFPGSGTLSLALCSLVLVAASLILYGKSQPEEVLYAHHPA